MKISEAWLREWVNPPLDTQALTAQLTMAGLEVDGEAAVAGGFSNVVVGRVVDCQPHPDADRLRVCTVDDGDATHQVVCGAPNARSGIAVAYARPGARLPDGLKIRKAKLRGVESAGMLCSVSELELGDDHDGILELPQDLTVGADLREALALDDTSIDIDLTPNRGDCLSVKGLAREVGLLNDLALTEPQIEPVPAVHDASFPVTLTHADGCPRYLGRVIRGINPTASSPLWLVEKLRRCGVRSIDPTVDITNFVLLELGQPMHAFDLASLSGGIDVRRATPGERLTLLDGRDVALDEQTLLITDADGPVAIAGVMGGTRSGIAEHTRDVFLECAYFNPLAVAGTARRYGLHTEASQRYERGVDFELQEQAIERATALLLDICGGEAGPVTVTEDRDALPERRSVSLRHGRLEDLLGVEIRSTEVDRLFAQLHFPVLGRVGEGRELTWTIQAPSHRFDIEREADLVEEVCRVYGYNNVPVRLPSQTLELGKVTLARSSERRLRDYLTDAGYLEAITYSFVDPALQDLLDPSAPVMRLENPMAQDQSVMRTSLLPGLADALRGNVARQADRVRLFEVGLCFEPEAGTDNLRQTQRVGALLWGRRHDESWAQSAADGVDFFDAKGDLERLLQRFGVAGALDVVPGSHPAFHPGQCAELLLDGRCVGRLGRLHPEVADRLTISGAVFAFEIDTDAVLARPRPTYQAVSRFPRVRRDLALLVNQSVSADAIRSACEAALGGILVDFTFFDVYTGKGIDLNEKSVAIGLTLQAPSATLTDAEIGQYVDRVTEGLEQNLGARLR